MKSNKSLNPPTFKEHMILRIMILLGVVYMFLFLKALINTKMVDHPFLFWSLFIVITFYCLKLIYEWVHYLFITIPETPVASKKYTVDIFTTYVAGEPYEMIVETLHAIKAITYPHQTYLCDEADDPFLRNICKELGIFHVTRKLKIDAKAGNINNALRQSTGELCVVLDPDHVPLPHFLDPIVSHFDDPEVGYVQIVQAYSNYHHGLIAKGAAQQTFQFYGPIMMCMNKYGTVQAIGANCTFRRTALESIGGHAAGLAEDMHTAMQLHAKGWKSVYAPFVLARGLVPDTLSAYYSQQLKWSRGVFELLVTSYPKLFNKLTWKQKLHYALIPMHYFSGVIFLLNFLIPIVSLAFNISPINIHILNFAVLGFPLIVSIVLIRQYVQSWVMEDGERGFHIVGGLLMLGTWWVFIVGLIYTIIRKKVPYIPTPKDGKEGNNWHLNIPNVVVIIISLSAVIYGLYHDWNPYSLMMAGLALMNCAILLFSVLASRQKHFRRLKMQNNSIYNLMKPFSYFKNIFWKARHKMYRRGKSYAMPFSLLIAAASIFYAYGKTEFVNDSLTKVIHKDILLSGIYAPNKGSGLSSIKLVNNYQNQSKRHFDIISFYIAWGDKKRCEIPLAQMDSVYNNGSIPMITWEPWQSLFTKVNRYPEEEKEKKVFSRIINGDYDDYLNHFSKQIKSLNRPVFIRFAHETDNPFYPWSSKGENSSEEFKAGWRYVYKFFERNGVYNVVWVWNPWKPNAVESYFPGQEYVDWLAVTNLNYGSFGPDKKWYTMSQLYNAFHKLPVFKSGLPVMLAEMGSLTNIVHQDKWFKNAFNELKAFPEIKAFVLFNTEWDYNILDSVSTNKYDWRFNQLDSLSFWVNQRSNNLNELISKPLNKLIIHKSEINNKRITNVNTIRGVNYTKGKNWLTDYHSLKSEEINRDFLEMKQIGVDAIKWYGPNFYDKNILTLAKANSIGVNYSFWIAYYPDFYNSYNQYEELSKSILKTINNLKDNKEIKSWNLGNPIMQKLSESYFKPELLYQEDAYLNWLRNLIVNIKKIDSKRPISIDIKANEDLIRITNKMHAIIPEINSFGIVVDDKSTGIDQIDDLNVDYFYSRIDVKNYIKLSKTNAKSCFINNWQDDENKKFVSFDGLKDVWGNKKYEYFELLHKWKGEPLPQKPYKFKILKPAVPLRSNLKLTYYALINVEKQWKMVTADKGLSLKWILVENDTYGNPLAMKTLGTGASITFSIPKGASHHKLYLHINSGKYISIIKTRLNTPLYN